MTVFRAEPATPPLYQLAEGVIWDDQMDLVRWVDISRGQVFAGTLSGDSIAPVEIVDLGQTASAVAAAQDGGLLIAAARGLATISALGAVTIGPDLLGDRANVRLNDGTVDLFGSFVVGTLTVDESCGQETLFRIFPDGRFEVLREGIELSNGVAFSLDGDTIYHVDTLAGTVSSHSYGPGAFNRTEPWIPMPLKFPAYPDGLTVDSTGALWVAQWGGSSVRRHAPTGELLDVVTVDAEQTSCAAFVGPNMDLLAITSAQEGLTSNTDLAGSLFLVDAGVTGVASHRWAGSTTNPYWHALEQDEL